MSLLIVHRSLTYQLRPSTDAEAVWVSPLLVFTSRGLSSWTSRGFLSTRSSCWSARCQTSRHFTMFFRRRCLYRVLVSLRWWSLFLRTDHSLTVCSRTCSKRHKYYHYWKNRDLIRSTWPTMTYVLLAPVCIRRTSWTRVLLSLTQVAGIRNSCAARSQSFQLWSVTYTPDIQTTVTFDAAKTLQRARLVYVHSWCTPRLLQLNLIWSTNVYSIEVATRAKFICTSRSPSSETVTRWTKSTYSSLAARQTEDSPQVGYPDIQNTSYINAGLPYRSDFS